MATSASEGATPEAAELNIQEVAPMVVDIRWDHLPPPSVKEYTLKYTPLRDKDVEGQEESIHPPHTSVTIEQLDPDTEYLFDLSAIDNDDNYLHVASKKITTGPAHGTNDDVDTSDANDGSTGSNATEKGYPGVATRVQEFEERSQSQGNVGSGATIEDEGTSKNQETKQQKDKEGLQHSSTVEADAVGKTMIVVTWQHPSGVRYGSKYKVTYSYTKPGRLYGSSEVTSKKTVNHPENKCRIEKLDPNKEYTVRVFWVPKTKGKDTLLGEQKVTTWQNIPSPASLSVGTRDWQTLEASWTQPAVMMKECVRAYHVSCVTAIMTSSNEHWQNISNGTDFVFKNLLPGTQYTVKVKCVCVDGSDSEPVCKTVYTKPLPVKYCAPERKDTSIRLNWKLGDGNTERVEATLMANQPPHETFGPKVRTQMDTNVLFEGLSPGTSYKYEIRSISGDQEDVFEQHITTMLCAPENLTPGQVGANDIEISWTPPTNVEKVSGYTVSYYVKGASESEKTIQIDGVNVTRWQITDLLDDTEYEVNIRSSGGTKDCPLKSHPVASSKLKTEVASVNNPEVATFTDSSIDVKWEKPSQRWIRLPGWMKRQKRELMLSISRVTSPKSPAISQYGVDDRKETQHQFLWLQPSTEYEISFDVVGTSSKKSATIKQWTRPLPVTGFHVVQKTRTTDSIQCEWVPPSCRFDGYIVSISAVGDSSDPKEVQLSGDHKTFTFLKLIPGQVYIVLIQTVLKVGTEKILSKPEEYEATTLPMAPRNVRVENVTDKSVSLKWDEPSRGQVDRYRVYLSPYSRIPPFEYVQGLTYEFDQLEPLTKYDITVRSMRGKDESEPTKSMSCTTKPSEVKSLRLGKVSYDGLTIVWDSVCDQAEYQVKIDSDEGTTEDRNPTDSSASFSGLTPGNLYTVTVVTQVGQDQSKAATKSFRTLVKPVDNIYINPDDVTTSSIYVSWDEPDGVVEDYRVSISPKHCSGDHTVNIKPQLHDLGHMFKGLQTGVEYTITIQARSGNNKSDPKEKIQHTKVEKVREVTTTDVDEHSATLYWVAPQGHVDRYYLYVNTQNQDTTDGTEIRTVESSMVSTTGEIPGKPVEIPGTVTKHVIRKLRPGASYNIAVQAKSGPFTSGPVCTSVTTKPAPPGRVEVTDVTGNTMALRWGRAEGIHDGYVIVTKAGRKLHKRETIPASDEPAYTIGSLHPGRTCDIEIRTTNAGTESKPVQISQSTMPLPPRDLSVNFKEQRGCIFVSWSPLGRSSDVDKYLVQISPSWAVETASQEVRSDQLSVQFQDPMLGPKYEVTISSVSGDQQSEPVTKQYRLPLSKPANGEPMSEDTSIKVQWDSIRPGDKRYSYRLSIEQRNEVTSQQLEVADEQATSTNGDKVQGELEIQTCNKTVDHEEDSGSSDDVTKAKRFVEVPNSRSNRLSYTFDSLTPGVEYEIKVNCLSPKALIEPKSVDNGSDKGEISYYESPPYCVSMRTKPAAPADIVIKESDVHPTSIPISWPDAKGNVENYEVSIRDTKTKKCIQTESVTKVDGEALSHTFDNLEAGGQYIIEVKSVNKGDESATTRKTQPTPPLPPTDLQIHYDKPSKSIELTWEAPKGGRDEYIVDTDPQTDKDMPITVDKSRTSCTIPKVVPGENYTIAVRTKRGDLFSKRSTEQFRVPVSQAKNVQTKAEDAETIVVSWEEPEGKKTGYRVCIDPKDGTDKEPVNKSTEERTHCLKGLVPGRLYTISIITLCGEVESEPEKKTQRTKIRPVAEIITDGGVTGKSIRIRWSKPEGDQDKYRVGKISEEGNTMRRKHTLVSPPDLEYTFDRLCPGRQYILTVESGCGVDWSEETSKHQRTTVSPVSDLQVSNVTGVSFKLSWVHAMGDKDGYRIRVRPKLDELCESDDACKTPIPVAKDNNEYELKDLTSGREYTVDVITVSGDQESDPVSIEQRTVVAPVTNLHAISSKEGQLEIKWEEAKGDKDNYICTIEGHSSIIIPNDNKDEVLSELVPGEKYVITLVTVSGGVQSVEASCCQRVKPCPPKVHVKSTTTLDTLTVTWEDSMKECVRDYYEVKIHPTEDPQTLITDGTTVDNHYKFTGLQPGTRYQVSVRSMSEGHRSEEDFKIFTTEVSKPVIKNIKAEENRIEVELDKPNGNVENYIWAIKESDNNSQAQEIRVDARDGLSSNIDVVTPLQKSVQKGGPSSSNLLEEDAETNGVGGNGKLCPHAVLFPRLKPCKQYSIAVLAESAGKKSDHEHIYQHTRPHRPRKPECGNEGMNNFSVFWSPPQTEEERGRIVGYRVKFRRLANNLATIEEVGEDDWKWLDAGNTTQQKIDETNADNTDYEIGIVSVAEIESHKPEDEGRKIKIESEPVRFRYRTMSYGKKLLQNAFLIFVTVAFLIAMIVTAGFLFAVWMNKCRNVGTGGDFTFETNVTSEPVTLPPPTKNCLFQKAGEEFWIFIFFLSVLVIDVVFLIIWYQVVRKRFARGRLQLLDDETLDEVEEETAVLQTIIERTSRLLAYLRDTCMSDQPDNPSNRRPSENLESASDTESDVSDIWDESPIPSSFKKKRIRTVCSSVNDVNTNTEGEGTSPKALLCSDHEDSEHSSTENTQEQLTEQACTADASVAQNQTVNRESQSESSDTVTIAIVEEDENWEDDYMSPLYIARSVPVMDNQASEDRALEQEVDSDVGTSFLDRIGKKFRNLFKPRTVQVQEESTSDDNDSCIGEEDEIENIEASGSVQADERTPLLKSS